MKNYYQILNVSQNATDADIKRSYRILAKKYHPDVNPGDSAAADKFADINEANAVLSDPKSRSEYDAKLKESMSPHPTEDIIARQRAQAQAAARQAARRAQEQAMRTAAQQAQAAQFKGAGIQAQVQELRKQAFQAGMEKGANEAKAAAAAEIARLNVKLRTLTTENQTLKAQADELAKVKRELAETERDRADLEQELFNRDQELSQVQARAEQYEEKLRQLRDGFAAEKAAGRHANAEAAELRGQLDAEASNVKQLESEISRLIADCRRKDEEKAQADLRNQAQIELQHEKRRQLQDEIDELRRSYDELAEEVEALREENAQWQQYAKSEQFISDTERRMDDWAKKVKNDRRLAKPTLYGVLGVLIWATDEEIEAAYTKLAKRYSGKTDEAIVSKLQKVEEAYKTLSDPIERIAYNETLGITEEKIAEERRLIEENESLMEEYHKRIAGKEFWERFEEINADALSGDAEAQNTLGELYYYGEEIDRDVDQAVFWFKEAAKQKHPNAMYHLGECFVNGEGVEKNEATGRGFIRQAIKLGAKVAGSEDYD